MFKKRRLIMFGFKKRKKKIQWNDLSRDERLKAKAMMLGAGAGITGQDGYMNVEYLSDKSDDEHDGVL